MWLISTWELSRSGQLPTAPRPWPPSGSDGWPPPFRVLCLPGSGRLVVIRRAAPGSLELAGLPRPDGGTLDVPIERLPRPMGLGAWHFLAPCCGRWVVVLVEAAGAPKAPASVQQLGWACRTCAGLPASRAWHLIAAQRLDNALDRATEAECRRPSEKAIDWRRRRARAQAAIAKARKASDGFGIV